MVRRVALYLLVVILDGCHSSGFDGDLLLGVLDLQTIGIVVRSGRVAGARVLVMVQEDKLAGS